MFADREVSHCIISFGLNEMMDGVITLRKKMDCIDVGGEKPGHAEEAWSRIAAPCHKDAAEVV